MSSSGPPPAPARTADGDFVADVVIIGAGLAGLATAHALPDHLSVTVLDKGVVGRSGSSPWAQGGMAVAIGADDSPDLHARDTIVAGDGLCDPVAVRVLTTHAPARTAELLRIGAAFDRRPGREGSMDLADVDVAREGGQSVARSVHTADATGREMVRAMRAVVAPRVTRLPGLAVALTRGGPATTQVTGVAVQTPEGTVEHIRARAVVIATGGTGGLFAATTNQDTATGDGIALAWRAGAVVRDLEFVQFHPTGLAISGNWRFLLTEALRGDGATLHDADGHRFMTEVHADAELAPRHIVAGAILDQDGGMAWLDATGIGEANLASHFPTVLQGAREHGFDLATERVPVTPAAHYLMGGIRTDLWARTSLPGLYAVGEVASTGLHGANRMAGNSLAEALVYGHRAAGAIVRDLPEQLATATPLPTPDPGPTDLDVLDPLRDRLRQAMWRGAGPVRDGRGLTGLQLTLADIAVQTRDSDAAVDLATMQIVGPDAAATELRLAITTAELIRRAAERRHETRGGHLRTDFPDRDPALAGVHLEETHPPSAS